MADLKHWFWSAGATVWRVRPSAWALVAGGLISLIFSVLVALRTERALSTDERAHFRIAAVLFCVGTYGLGRMSVLLEEYRAAGDNALELAISATNKRGRLMRLTVAAFVGTVSGFVLLFA